MLTCQRGRDVYILSPKPKKGTFLELNSFFQGSQTGNFFPILTKIWKKFKFDNLVCTCMQVVNRNTYCPVSALPGFPTTLSTLSSTSQRTHTIPHMHWEQANKTTLKTFFYTADTKIWYYST